jgi:hypothetical protein
MAVSKAKDAEAAGAGSGGESEDEQPVSNAGTQPPRQSLHFPKIMRARSEGVPRR